MGTLPATPPEWQRALLGLSPAELSGALAAGRADDYLPWDKLRRKVPPSGLTHEQWWAGIKLTRTQQYRELPFQDTDGNPFVYALTDTMLAALDDVSRRAGGTMSAPELVANPLTRDRYLINSLMEESITSSQLEGAATTRRVAKEMLRSGRRPRTPDERMIRNNFQAMQFVREHMDEDLTPSLVCELHRVVTEGTLEDPETAGRLQLPGEVRVGVWSQADDVLIHQPPPAEQLPERLNRLCAFANAESSSGPWMHPVLRAIVTHFMTGYDHYFVDGNGRTARALFYWVALRNKLWLLEFVTISKILRHAPTKYGRSYVYTEQDDSDVTYFALHQLDVIRRSIDDLERYLESKAEELREAREIVSEYALNHRQTAVVEGALQNHDLRITAKSHASSHRVTLPTARADLVKLESLGLLVSHREGRSQVWVPARDLTSHLAREV